MSDSCNCGWVKLYHPRGPQVTIPVTVEPLDYQALFNNVSAMLDAGFLAEAAGLEAGEDKQLVGYVLRRQKENDDNTTTEIVDLYSPDEQMTYKFLTVYLNGSEDVKRFEAASGLKLANMQVMLGQAPQRGASKQTDKLIYKVPRPFGVIRKPNPKHDPNETDVKKKKPKWLFARWESEGPMSKPEAQPAAVENQSQEQPEATPEQNEAKLKAWLPVMLKKNGMNPELVKVDQALDSIDDYLEMMEMQCKKAGVPESLMPRARAFTRYQYYLMAVVAAGPDVTTLQAMVGDIKSDPWLSQAQIKMLVDGIEKTMKEEIPF